ncbi:MAG: hypothetical protein Q7S73_03025 [bacterium]|nr:hypothetical protein [bacterium]
MEMPLSEILDRHSIVRLKIERLSPVQKNAEPLLQREFAAYSAAIEDFHKKNIEVKKEWLEGLYKINGRCWDLEADIRQGKEKKLGLEEVGRRALLLRDINSERVALKNKITKESGLGFPEIKTNHASANPNEDFSK